MANEYTNLSFAEEEGLTDEQLPWVPEVVAALMGDAEFFQGVLEAYQEIYCEEMGDGEEESES
jgi:hypothetical protein